MTRFGSLIPKRCGLIACDTCPWNDIINRRRFAALLAFLRRFVEEWCRFITWNTISWSWVINWRKIVALLTFLGSFVPKRSRLVACFAYSQIRVVKGFVILALFASFACYVPERLLFWTLLTLFFAAVVHRRFFSASLALFSSLVPYW